MFRLASRPVWARSLLGALLISLPSMAGEVRAEVPAETLDEATEAAAPAARLEASTLPATGRRATELVVEQPGRWSLRAESPRGVALRLVDRMAGPGEWAGVAGGEDGRLDVFLDAGVYRLETRGIESDGSATDGSATDGAVTDDRAENVALRVDGFAPRDGGVLDAARAETRENLVLRDLEAVGFELVVRAGAEDVMLEAAGRHLTDLRVWRRDADGPWMLDAEPVGRRIEPRAGEPLQLLQLATRLEPGVYDLVAYGGPGLPWTSDEGEAPLHLRSGVPRLAVAERQRRTLSPFGFDRYLLPEPADFVRLEVPRSDPPRESSVSAAVAPWQAADPFGESGALGVVTQETVPPVVELGTRAGVVKRVTVFGEAGRPYVLQHLARARGVVGVDAGSRWLSVLRAGSPHDILDVTAVLDSQERGSQRRMLRPAGLVLRPGVALDRALDLTDSDGEQTLVLDVQESLDLRVEAPGLDVRLEPFETADDAERPAPREDGGSWRLEPGPHRLGLSARRTGAVTLRLEASRDGAGAGSEIDTARQVAARFGAVELSSRQTHRLHLGVGAPATVIDRTLPIDLSEPLPLALSSESSSVTSSGSVEVPVRVGGAGRIVARAEDGAALELSLDGGAWTRELIVPAGGLRGTLRLRAGAAVETPTWAVLGFEPSPPPAPTRDASSPPVLRAGAPLAFDLDRNETKRLAVEVDEPALYRLESTGLLDAVGAVATPTRPQLASDDDTGSGRNFLLQPALRAGLYRLVVHPLGASAGHLGVRLTRAPVHTGGSLRLGVAARRLLAPGEAVAYDLPIERGGRYRLQVLSLGPMFRVRLEDADGWPVLPPGPLADTEVELAAGRYRVVVLPRSVAARAVVRVDRVLEAPSFAGRGPHPLPLDRRVEHLWREPRVEGQVERQGEGQGDRQSDVPLDAPSRADRWHLELPAAVDLEISIRDAGPGGRAGGFEATLVPLDASGGAPTNDAVREPVRVPARGWSGRVPAGRYALLVRALRRDDRRAYALRVRPHQLVAGETRRVEAPARLELSVGEDALYEVTTFGTLDVRARLMSVDAGGDTGADTEPLAQSDDRRGDWNPRLARRLAPGRYELWVEPVAGADPVGGGEADAHSPIEVAFSRLPEIDAPALRVESSAGAGRAARAQVELGDAVVRLPLEVTPGAAALVVQARAGGAPLELALEARAGNGSWRPVAEARSGVASRAEADDRARIAVALPLGVSFRGAGGDPPELRLRLQAPDRGGAAATVTAAAVPADRQIVRASEAVSPRLVRLPDLGDGALGVARVGFAADAAPHCLEIRGTVDAASVPGAALRPAPSLQAVVDDGLWLLGDPSRPPRLAARALAAGDAVRVAVPDGGGHCAVAAGGPVAVLAEGVDAAADVAPSVGVARAVEAQGRRSLVLLPTSAAVRPIRLVGAREVALRVVEPTAPLASASASWGATDARVAVAGGLRLALPPGAKTLRLSLDGGLAAVLLAGEGESLERQATLWADDGAVETVLETTADELLVLDVAEPPRGGALRLHAEPIRGSSPALGSDVLAQGALAPSRPLEERTPTRGRRLVAVAPPTAPATLRVRGARSAIFLAADGSSRRALASPLDPALDLPVDAGVGGQLVLEHEPGLLLAWVDVDGGAPGPWPATASDDAPRVLEPPAVAALDGQRRRVDLELATPAIVHLRADTPSVSALWHDSSARPRVTVHADATALDLPLPAGRSRLELRGLAVPLTGTLRVDVEEPPVLAEGLGPEVLLEPGASRWFRVELEHAATLGFGVASGADEASDASASARLLDAAGHVLGAGVVFMRRLEPGTYYLALELPLDAPPVAAQAAIAGLEAPGTGPPREVVERYLRERSSERASEREAEDGAEGDRISRRFVEVVEGVGVVVRVDVDADARQQIDLPAQAAGEEGVGGVVRQAVREDHADARGGVESAADTDIGDRRQGALGGAAEAFVVVLEVDLDVEQTARLDFVRQDVGEAVVLDAAETVVGDVVDGFPEAGAEAQTMLGGLGRGGAADGAQNQEDAENA